MASFSAGEHTVSKFAISASGRIAQFALIAVSLALAGCTTPDAVAKFCASAITTLTSAQPVFADMKQSCLREVNSRTDFGTFTPPLEDDANCTAIGKQADGAEAAATVLADYFGAINALASFGTAKAGTDAQSLVTKTSAAVGAGSAAQTALGSIAQFLTTAATSGYQSRALEKDLPQVSKNIAAVTAALITVVQDDYVGRQLKSEEQKLTIRYKDFARNKSPEALLMLDTRWQAEEQAIAAKRQSARCLVTALEALSKCFVDLAAKSRSLKGKEVPGLLAPYIAQIQALIPQVQKAF
jgi:hypothetical protein